MTNCEDEPIRTGRLTESQRLSIPMRESWESGDFWIMYAARSNFAFDAIYWQKIDKRFFEPMTTCLDPSNAWKEKVDILEPEERQKLEEYVDPKLRHMETRVLAWDPDEHTLEYMAKMNA
ncbi:hypothetical protein PENCOP_c008G05547 [Penicillium coprophilum]|uniref:Uncharacterized protein n=1 Tax=Penicillium coprophilum TaxID=36646 RepID=A0A1V6UJ11_9EURO|nr:hypothetical protein PENCOP_c008G05547 [Penicillium coprophilum]